MKKVLLTGFLLLSLAACSSKESVRAIGTTGGVGPTPVPGEGWDPGSSGMPDTSTWGDVAALTINPTNFSDFTGMYCNEESFDF